MKLTAEVHEETFSAGKASPTKADGFFRSPYVAHVEVVSAAVPELHCMPEFVLIGGRGGSLHTYMRVYKWAMQEYKQKNALMFDRGHIVGPNLQAQPHLMLNMHRNQGEAIKLRLSCDRSVATFSYLGTISGSSTGIKLCTARKLV